MEWSGWYPLGKPPFQKSAVFLNIVQKAFDPPPFYLNICPILQGVFEHHVVIFLDDAPLYNGQNELPTFKMLYKCRF